MSENLFTQFRRLVVSPPRLYGEVVSTSGDLAMVELPDGSLIQSLGTATVAQKVFVRAGVIEGEAPNLPVTSIVL